METPDPSGERRNSHGTFHRYLHLPFELRAEIRAFAIMGCHSTGENCRSRLALVSKEWQVDVEKSLFSKIQIDPLNEEGVSDFKKYFTDGREKYLTQLEIPMDDSAVTGLWERSNGLLGISQLMEKTGQLFQHLNGWNLSSDGRKQSSIAVIFTSLNEFRGDYWRVGKFEDQMMQTVSLWEPNRLSGVTEGDIPTNVALWAIKSEFPSSLNMVTHLSFNIDCVPIAAAKRIIQVMPNLESCNFQMIFTCEVEEAWKDLTDFIHQLRACAPSLRSLRLNGHGFCRVGHECRASTGEFENALRELSQRLEDLCVFEFHLSEAFFSPFLENADAAASGSQGTWPKLEHLSMDYFLNLESSDPDRATLSIIDILTAAAKATSAMPKLKCMQISDGIQWIQFQRENSKIELGRLSEGEERTILKAYAPIIGAQASWVLDKDCDEESSFRTFTALPEGTGASICMNRG